MKEATGELSGTVITVVAIAAVAAVFTMILLPMLKRNIALTTACNSAGDGAYEQTLENGDVVKCEVDASGNTECSYMVGGSEQTNKKACKNANNENL